MVVGGLIHGEAGGEGLCESLFVARRDVPAYAFFLQIAPGSLIADEDSLRLSSEEEERDPL